MSWHNKVLWSEGLFLQQHHFQQQSRYVENIVQQTNDLFWRHPWGVVEAKLDKSLLEIGKISFLEIKGRFPDGTLINAPADDLLPQALDFPSDVTGSTVYLSLPLWRPGGNEIDEPTDEGAASRAVVADWEVTDTTPYADTPATVQVGKTRPQLLMDEDRRSDFSVIPILRVIEARPDKKLVLDDDFIPSYIDCSQSTVLDGFLREIVGLLDQRAEAIAARINPSARAGAAETADYLMLMVINRHRPLLAHYIAMKSVHPETLYMFLLGLLGEFAIFSSEDRRPKKFDPYDHADLTATFKPVMQELRQALSMVLEQKAINLPFKVHRYGIRVAQLADKSLLQDAMFVVSMSADVGDEVLRRTFPAQVKIGSVEMIRELVNVALPGIRVRVLPVAPRQIPFHTGKLYFALEQTGKYWDALAKSGGIALHLSGDFPNLEIDLWAIRE